MPTLALLIGIWTTTCIQTQISSHHQGRVRESYIFEENGDYAFKRTWYKDAQCAEEIAEDKEVGSMTLGPTLGGLFISGKTFSADFSTSNGTDLGAIALTEGQSLKVARGILGSSFRNTMLSIFEYKKQ